jgi:hypothetical protein
VSFTVNFIPSTNPPVLSLVWPPAGTTVLGTNFTLQAQVSDPTATVTATVNGTATPGLVGANGSVWVQNLALNPGNNTVTLTANTTLGGMTAINFVVAAVANGLGRGVDLPPSGQPLPGYFNLNRIQSRWWAGSAIFQQIPFMSMVCGLIHIIGTVTFGEQITCRSVPMEWRP